MKSAFYICVAAVLLPGMGCTTMHVHTLIFDQSFAEKGNFLEFRTRKVDDLRWAKIVDGSYEATHQQVRNQQKMVVDTLKSHSGTGPNDITITKNAADMLQQSLQASVDKAFSDSLEDYKKAHTTVEEAIKPHATARDAEALYAAAWARLRRADDRLDRLKADLLVVAEKLVPDLPTHPAVKTEVVSTQAQSAAAVDTLIGNQGVQTDPLASLVINAPAEAWTGVINRTDAGGTIGNTDVAVKMDSVGEFTIKGVRDDTSKMTTATFQGLNQAVKLAAAAYGIPLPTNPSSTAGQPGNTTPAPATFNAAQAQENRINSRAAALTLLHSIIDQEQNLEAPATDASAQGAIAQIQTAFTSQKDHIAIKQQ